MVTQSPSLNGRKVLLIITGGIAAYKGLELIRLMTKSGAQVRCILTKGGQEFITPLSVAALSGNPCYTDLFDLNNETEMGHIQLSRWADIVLVAPATANIIAKTAHGICDDLASTALMATNKPVMVAPSMNPAMWANPATQDNIKTIEQRGIRVLTPETGETACGETGEGRLQDPEAILSALCDFFGRDLPLFGKKAIVTSGPTYEPIDPVRFIGNRSSGKQGHAIAVSLRRAGADVTLITGPTALPDPEGMTTIHIETAVQMMAAVEEALPADIAVCAAAVADYGVKAHPIKQKKAQGSLAIDLVENPDILYTVSNHAQRPAYVIGFAAETDHLEVYAQEKLNKKGCDAIVANQVGAPDTPVFGQDKTSALWMTKSGTESFQDLSKNDLAAIVTDKIITSVKEKQA